MVVMKGEFFQTESGIAIGVATGSSSRALGLGIHQRSTRASTHSSNRCAGYIGLWFAGPLFRCFRRISWSVRTRSSLHELASTPKLTCALHVKSVDE